MSSSLRKIIFFAVLIAITYLAYRYMIKPANQALIEQKTRLEEKAFRLAEFERAVAAAKDLNQQLQQLQEAFDFFESKIPPKRQIHKVLEQVTVIAQEKGLEITTIRTLAIKNNSGYIEQPLQMELVGNFDSFYAFLLELEKLPRIMKVRKVDLKKQKGEEGRIVADFIVSIFFQQAT